MDYFVDNIEFLYGIAKKAGLKKGQVSDELGIHVSTPGKWRTRGVDRINHTTLLRIKNFFRRFVDVEITEEMLFHQDLRKIAGDIPILAGENGQDLTDREKHVMRHLRKFWHPSNREALFDFILKTKI